MWGRGKPSLKSPSSYSFSANTNASSVLQEPVSKQAKKQKHRNSVIISLQGDFSQQTVKHKVAPLLCKTLCMYYVQLSLHKINVFCTAATLKERYQVSGKVGQMFFPKHICSITPELCFSSWQTPVSFTIQLLIFQKSSHSRNCLSCRACSYKDFVRWNR